MAKSKEQTTQPPEKLEVPLITRASIESLKPPSPVREDPQLLGTGVKQQKDFGKRNKWSMYEDRMKPIEESNALQWLKESGIPADPMPKRMREFKMTSKGSKGSEGSSQSSWVTASNVRADILESEYRWRFFVKEADITSALTGINEINGEIEKDFSPLRLSTARFRIPKSWQESAKASPVNERDPLRPNHIALMKLLDFTNDVCDSEGNDVAFDLNSASSLPNLLPQLDRFEMARKLCQSRRLRGFLAQSFLRFLMYHSANVTSIIRCNARRYSDALALLRSQILRVKFS
ncbi:hypothetical protein A0H81_12884 [Grifola frondosa]|uniref:Uncharacterized protein n=1 Tax=Grifola frondosa TaxID=5627 RepID=A0A1C7LSF3_GRIFR|nr:hypothetical protein A0H81_12884 [Grifola frondosa]